MTAVDYEQVFKSIFDTVHCDHPSFVVGKSLQGIITDWSDTQRRAIEQATSPETASRVLKGCQVSYLNTLMFQSWMHQFWSCDCVYMPFVGSLPEISQTSCRKSQQKHNAGCKALTSIAYHIPQCQKAKDVIVFFQVLGGQRPLQDAINLLPESSVLQGYLPEHNPSHWEMSFVDRMVDEDRTSP